MKVILGLSSEFKASLGYLRFCAKIRKEQCPSPHLLCVSPPPQRPKSALERLYSGDHQRGKMSAEEQLERMKRHQKALVRERKRTLSQGERTGLLSARYLSQPLPGDLGSVC